MSKMKDEMIDRMNAARERKATCTHPRERNWRRHGGDIVCGACNTTVYKKKERR